MEFLDLLFWYFALWWLVILVWWSGFGLDVCGVLKFTVLCVGVLGCKLCGILVSNFLI